MFASEVILIHEIPVWTLVPVVLVLAGTLTSVVRWITGPTKKR